MDNYDYERPFIPQSAMYYYQATDTDAASRYGHFVRATQLSNVEYKIRFSRHSKENNMKPPPSCGRIFLGFLVIRNLDTPDQYETWMPDHVFEEMYNSEPSARKPSGSQT